MKFHKSITCRYFIYFFIQIKIKWWSTTDRWGFFAAQFKHKNWSLFKTVITWDHVIQGNILYAIWCRLLVESEYHISAIKRPGCLFKISAKRRSAYWNEGAWSKKVLIEFSFQRTETLIVYLAKSYKEKQLQHLVHLKSLWRFGIAIVIGRNWHIFE